MSLTGEDLDAIDRAPARDDLYCVVCALEWWACACDPSHPERRPTPEEIEDAREQRLSRAERGGR
jgi:hypothetical protein